MNDTILVINSGSSSIKLAVYSRDSDGGPVLRGKIAGIGRAPVFSAVDARARQIDTADFGTLNGDTDHAALIVRLLTWLDRHQGAGRVVAVGHRVVHGGQGFTGPILIDAAALQALETLVPLAPLHQPHNLAAIHAVAQWHAGLTQVACFDTRFHRTQDRLAQQFALPAALTDEGVVRYGFHGLSYDYIASVLPDHLGARADGRIIVAHLGNGASMCAMHNRQSVATSMGFTALDGLMMGRRCGALDPGVVLYLMQNKGLSVAEVETLLYRQSGLLGVSGISNAMHVLEHSQDPNARAAIDLYCYRAALVLGGLVTAIGGLDGIVFTAGIGEKSALTRRLICDRLAFLGVTLDADRNSQNAPRINGAWSQVDVLVLPTDEEGVIAKATRQIIAP